MGLREAVVVIGFTRDRRSGPQHAPDHRDVSTLGERVAMPQDPAPQGPTGSDDQSRGATADPAADAPDADHTEREDHPWERNIPPHPPRKDSPDYVRARKMMVNQAKSVAGFFYGEAPFEDHHGGGLWLKDADGWFMVRNLAGIEWSAQFCADPAKVDQLRTNARRLYAAFPG